MSTMPLSHVPVVQLLRLWYDYTKHLTCNHVHVPVELSTLFTSVGAMKKGSGRYNTSSVNCTSAEAGSQAVRSHKMQSIKGAPLVPKMTQKDKYHTRGVCTVHSSQGKLQPFHL